MVNKSGEGWAARIKDEFQGRCLEILFYGLRHSRVHEAVFLRRCFQQAEYVHGTRGKQRGETFQLLNLEAKPVVFRHARAADLAALLSVADGRDVLDCRCRALFVEPHSPGGLWEGVVTETIVLNLLDDVGDVFRVNRQNDFASKRYNWIIGAIGAIGTP